MAYNIGHISFIKKIFHIGVPPIFVTMGIDMATNFFILGRQVGKFSYLIAQAFQGNGSSFCPNAPGIFLLLPGADTALSIISIIKEPDHALIVIFFLLLHPLSRD